MSPVVDGDLVIVAAALSNWGSAAARAHRLIGLDKRTGEVIYVSNPGGRPYDTAYASPLIATINGVRLLIAGLGDGAVHAIKAQTGEKAWSFVAAKRAINTGVAISGSSVFVSHGDENLEGVELGLVAAIDGSQSGDIKTTKWADKGTEFGYSAPLVDGSRLYQIDNGSTLRSYDTATGKEMWTLPLGAAQKASPVLADGKIYVGTDGGAFFIVRPSAGQRRDLEPGRSAEQHEQLQWIPAEHAGTGSRHRRDLSRPAVLLVERCDLCDWLGEPPRPRDSQRMKPPSRGQGRLRMQVAHQSEPGTRAIGEAPRPAVRRRPDVSSRVSRRHLGHSRAWRGDGQRNRDHRQQPIAQAA
jgi:hypothetical protein